MRIEEKGTCIWTVIFFYCRTKLAWLFLIKTCWYKIWYFLNKCHILLEVIMQRSIYMYAYLSNRDKMRMLSINIHTQVLGICMTWIILFDKKKSKNKYWLQSDVTEIDIYSIEIYLWKTKLHQERMRERGVNLLLNISIHPLVCITIHMIDEWLWHFGPSSY